MPFSPHLTSLRRSPYARHPRLLWRKVVERLGLRRAWAFTPPSSALRLARMTGLADTLRAWARRVDGGPAILPSSYLFRQEFSREELLRLCEHGPADAPDLRGDVKLLWEFGRSQSHTVNALRCEPDRRPALARDIASELRDWVQANAQPDGPAWTNAMEVAIRAVNWIVADAALDRHLGKAFGREQWVGWLWSHGRAIERHLEARLISSNHYLANLLGLLYLGRQLEVASWAEFGGREFQAALLAQTEADGGLYEASLPYHALVTEMALLACLLLKDEAEPAFLRRVADMAAIVSDFTAADGEVFRFGDDDGGRIIPLDLVARDRGRGRVVTALAEEVFARSFPRNTSRLCPQSGWWITREGIFTVSMEFGGVGFLGQGAHAHNDLLSMCVDVDGHALFTDPGSYLYTPAPEERNRFRSTSSHSTVMVDGREQLPIPEGRDSRGIFSLPGPAKAARIVAQEAASLSVQGPFRRTVSTDGQSVTVTDVIERPGPHQVEWFFQLHPGVEARVDQGRVHLKCGERALLFSADPTVPMELRDTWFSPYYGQRVPTRCIAASVDMQDTIRRTWRLALRQP